MATMTKTIQSLTTIMINIYYFLYTMLQPIYHKYIIIYICYVNICFRKMVRTRGRDGSIVKRGKPRHGVVRSMHGQLVVDLGSIPYSDLSTGFHDGSPHALSSLLQTVFLHPLLVQPPVFTILKPLHFIITSHIYFVIISFNHCSITTSFSSFTTTFTLCCYRSCTTLSHIWSPGLVVL